MKSFTAKFLILLSILCCQLITVKGAIGIDSLDKALSKIKNPDKKVDLILAFLDKPENQYLENAEVYAIENYGMVVILKQYTSVIWDFI